MVIQPCFFCVRRTGEYSSNGLFGGVRREAGNNSVSPTRFGILVKMKGELLASRLYLVLRNRKNIGSDYLIDC